ncbi:MAG: GNAT family N-acetyltransferase [Bdellovibrionaceae bacterium]|nr:GNAT family N-acetyltransferase [Pseudobdellovibrionaceae bacterium]
MGILVSRVHTMKRLEVRTRRLILRPLMPSDYTAWSDAYTAGLPQQNKWDRDPYDPKKWNRKWFNTMRHEHERLAQADDYYRYYVFEKRSGALIGQIDFNIFVRDTHQFANFGYQIFNRYWGRGYGREAAKAGLKIGFRQLKLNRLEAAINLDNRKSIRLAKLIGMRREGIKKRYWFEFGQWIDHLIYVANPEDIGLKARAPQC